MAPFLSRSIALVAALLVVPVTRVSACEDDCKANITTALVGNYSVPVDFVFAQLADGIQSQFLTPNSAPPLSFLAPIIQEYQARAYPAMQNSIFDRLFHGKCQNPTTGIDPPGCPKPDCPVICGTPGSMVHHFPLLRVTAFNSTVHLLESIVKSNTTAYQKVRQGIEASSFPRPRQRRMLRFMRNLVSTYAEALVGSERFKEKREDVLDAELRGLFREVRPFLVKACGGSPSGRLNGLPNCSWESSFKQFILTFP